MPILSSFTDHEHKFQPARSHQAKLPLKGSSGTQGIANEPPLKKRRLTSFRGEEDVGWVQDGIAEIKEDLEKFAAEASREERRALRKLLDEIQQKL